MWPETASSETPEDQDNIDEIDVNNRDILKEGQDMPEVSLLTVNYMRLYACCHKMFDIYVFLNIVQI
jgi:uncharacterized protein YunC (DUF1805 family)